MKKNFARMAKRIALEPCIAPPKFMYRWSAIGVGMILFQFLIVGMAWTAGTVSPIHALNVLMMLIWVMLLRHYVAGFVYIHRMETEERAIFDQIVKGL